MKNYIAKFILGYTSGENKPKILSDILVIVALINIISVLPDSHLIFSKYGLVSPDVNKYFIRPSYITLSQITDVFAIIGVNYVMSFNIIFIVYIGGLIMMLFDYWRLFFSILIVFLHAVLLNSAFLFSYGADSMIGFLLYCNLFFCLSIKAKNDSIYSFTIRLMQIQLCIIYLFSGLGKALGVDWYSGNAIWLIFNQYMGDGLLNIVTQYTPKWLYKIFSIGVLTLELIYPFFIFNKKTKYVMITLIILLHIGICILINLYTFGIVMIIFNLIAFYPKDVECFVSTRLKPLNAFMNPQKQIS